MFRFFCKHEWKEISKEVLPSAWEQMSSKNITNVKHGGPWLYAKKLVIVLGCSKCGELWKEVEVCPDDDE